MCVDLWRRSCVRLGNRELLLRDEEMRFLKSEEFSDPAMLLFQFRRAAERGIHFQWTVGFQ